MWIKVTQDGRDLWINSAQVRAIGRNEYGGTTVAFTSQHKLGVGQSVEQVLEALGYKSPPLPPLEHHQTDEDSDVGEDEFAEQPR